MHLDLAEGVQGAAYLLAGGGREDLVGDDHGARPGADPGGEPVPGADGLLLEAAPVQLHQVERGEEVLVEAVRGVEHAPARRATRGSARAGPARRRCRSWGRPRGPGPGGGRSAPGSGRSPLTLLRVWSPARCPGRRRGRGRARPRDADGSAGPRTAGGAGPGVRAQGSRRRAGPRRAARPAPAPSPGTARAPSAPTAGGSAAGAPTSPPTSPRSTTSRRGASARTPSTALTRRTTSTASGLRSRQRGTRARASPRRAGDRPTPRIPAAVRATGSGSPAETTTCTESGPTRRRPLPGQGGQVRGGRQVAAPGPALHEAGPAHRGAALHAGRPDLRQGLVERCRDQQHPRASGRPRRGPRRRAPAVRRRRRPAHR